MEVQLDKLQVKFDYHSLNLIFKAAILFVVEMVSAQYLEKINDWSSVTEFSMEVHLDNLRAKFQIPQW